MRFGGEVRLGLYEPLAQVQFELKGLCLVSVLENVSIYEVSLLIEPTHQDFHRHLFLHLLVAPM